MNRRTGVTLATMLAGALLAGSPSARADTTGDIGSTTEDIGTTTRDVGNFVEAVPREHRVAVFTDSVGLGAKTQIPAAFPADWEVNVDGQPARFVKQMQTQYVEPRLATSPQWFGDHVVMAAGYNAPLVSKSQMDVAEFDRQLDEMMATLTNAGVKHVHWVTLREVDPQYISGAAWRQIQPYYWYFPLVNERLEAALARHPNLTLVDWAAAANQPGLTYDAIHLNPTGARLYAQLIRQSVDVAAARLANKSTTKVHVPGGEGGAAAVVNLTTTRSRTTGYLTVHKCGEKPPTASVHNFVRSQTVAHAAIAPLDDGGDFCVTTPTATHVIVDVTGIIRSGAGFSATRPTRWNDTRGSSKVGGGSTLTLDLDDIAGKAGVSGTPDALALIVTAVGGDGVGHVTVSTCGTNAKHSNVNFTSGAATPNLVVVRPDDDGRICLSVSASTHLVVDLMGVFDETAAISVDEPDRLRDSRSAGAKIAAGGTVRLDLDDHLSPDASAAILNLTGLHADATGYFTAYPCADGFPTASNLNVAPGDVAANAAVITPDANGEICIRSHSSADIVVDLLGEIGDSLDGFTPRRVLDTRRR